MLYCANRDDSFDIGSLRKMADWRGGSVGGCTSCYGLFSALILGGDEAKTLGDDITFDEKTRTCVASLMVLLVSGMMEG